MKENTNFFFKRSYPQFNFTNFQWKVLSNEEMKLVSLKNMNGFQKKGEIFTLLDMWNLHLINKGEISFLLEPSFFIDKNGIEHHNLMTYYEKIEEIYDENSPATIYFPHSQLVHIELRIDPIIQTTFFSEIKEAKILPIGFIAWQVSMLFTKLFLDEYEESEIGNILGNLQLTSFKVFDDNIFMLDVSS